MKLVIAKPGYDAITETDPDNLIFSSDYNTFKYFKNGSTPIYIPASVSVFTQENTIFTHDLGYCPFFIATWDITVGGGNFSNLSYSWADAGAYFHLFVYTTTTELILRVESSGLTSGITIPIWYKIFKNNLGLS